MNQDKLTSLIGNLIVRVVYFVIVFLAVLFIVGARSARIWAEGDGVGLLAVAGIAGLAAALIGPFLYTVESQRGRGTLKEVKRLSEDPIHKSDIKVATPIGKRVIQKEEGEE